MLKTGRMTALVLGLAVFCSAPALGADGAHCDNPSNTAETQADMSDPYLATATKPAQVPVAGRASPVGSSALELTVRPKAEDPDSPFLVQVFGPDACGEGAGLANTLLGTFSFYPLRLGKAQKFVVQAPKTELSAGSNSQVTVKLIPANPARTLQNSAIEIVGAKVVN
jgi:hypothetical protein